MGINNASGETVNCLPIKQDSSGGASPTHLAQVNVAHCLSRVNRRMYHEDRVYRCRVHLQQGITRLKVYALAPSWRVMSALRLAKEAWLNNTMQEFLALKKGDRPKWRGFRVQGPLGTTAHPSMFPQVATADSSGIMEALLTGGDFDLSKVIGSDDTEYRLTLEATPAAGYLGVFSEYAQHRPVNRGSPADLYVQSSIGYDELNDDLDLNLLDDVASEGNNPPYAQAMPADQQMILIADIVNDGNDATMSQWFDVPSGWLVMNTPTVGETLGNHVCLEVKSKSNGEIWSEPIGKTVKKKDGTYMVVKP